jgi:hypothetical protein
MRVWPWHKVLLPLTMPSALLYFCTQPVNPPGFYNALERTVAAVWLLSFMALRPSQGYGPRENPMMTY